MKIQSPRKSLLRFALLALSTITLGPVALHAQDAPPPMHDGGPRGGRGGAEMQQRQLDHMTKELGLTPDQVTQIKTIQADNRAQMTALREDTSIAGPDRRAKMMAMREAEQTKVKSVLTDAQKVKFDAMMEKMHERRDQRKDDSAPPPPPPSSN